MALSDSNGYIHDPEGIKLNVIKEIKEVAAAVSRNMWTPYPQPLITKAAAVSGRSPATLHCPVPPRMKSTVRLLNFLVKNGCFCVAEGANMPSTPEAIAVYQKAGVLYAPAKAANAGGVATSALEMCQNSMRYSWTFEEVDAKLKEIMEGIFHACYDASRSMARRAT